MSPVRIVGLEEHFVIPGLLEAWGKLPPDRRDLAFRPAAEGDTGRLLLELGPERIAAMDATGLSVQMLSLNVYYSGFGPAVEAAFATFGVGWHYDAGVEFLRMVVAGVFDRFPRLQVVVGHWGELVLFFLERIQHLANVAGLPRNLHEYARSNLMVAPSGILSHRYLRWALEVVGAGRIVFSTDYPFEAASQGGAQVFPGGG
jgi:predicted TIM-barrel fold metal-dependent hydrolase